MSGTSVRPSFRSRCRLCIPVLIAIIGSVVSSVAHGKGVTDSTSTSVSLVLGYSFGLANNPFGDAPGDGSDNKVSENEPLLGFSARLGESTPVHADLALAMANFGRLVQVINDAQSTEAAADVRRSILADLTIRPRIVDFGHQIHLYASSNVGFVFDAQKDQNDAVQDASSYLLVGPTLQAGIGERSLLTLDLFAGQSEVMTNLELFSSEWTLGETRFRPRIGFILDNEDNANGGGENSYFNGKFMFGLWADMGLSDRYGDTYAIFVSRSIADFR